MTSEKTIAFVTPYFPPYGGGLERYAYEIAKRLQGNYGWRVVIITSGEKSGKDSKEIMDGLVVYRLSYRFKFSNSPFSFAWLKKISQILREENPDIINVHMPVPGIGDLASLLIAKKPMILTYHTGSMHKGKLLPDLFIWLYEHVPLRILLWRANYITCPSDFVRLGFLKDFLYKSMTISPGVDGGVFKPEPSRKDNHPTVLFVASLSRSYEHKGLKNLIDAVSIVKKNIPDVRLVIVGEGDRENEYKAYVKTLFLEDNIFFMGRLDGMALAEVFQAADLFTLPSSNESFGMTILEAMSCGLPVVATNVGGIPSLVQDGKTGLLVPVNDVFALSRAIESILIDPRRARQFGEAGLMSARDNFQWDVSARKYNDIFKSKI